MFLKLKEIQSSINNIGKPKVIGKNIFHVNITNYAYMYSNTSPGSEILSVSDTCDGQMIQKLNKIQLSINNINIILKRKSKEIGATMFYCHKPKA